MQQEIIIGRKSENLEQGYVFAPYVPMNIQPQVHVYESKTTRIKRKINKLFNLGKDYTNDTFLPNKTIQSRYSTKIINTKLYGVITVPNRS